MLLFILSRCEKDKAFSIDVSVITPTDATGNSIGAADNTDWTEDGDWNEAEIALFRSDPIDMTGAEVATITMQPGFPNPCLHQIAIAFTPSKPTFIRIVIVDAKLKKLAQYNFLTSSGLNVYNIPFAPATFPINNNYRIYYTFNAPGYDMYYKGHGDVSIK